MGARSCSPSGLTSEAVSHSDPGDVSVYPHPRYLLIKKSELSSVNHRRNNNGYNLACFVQIEYFKIYLTNLLR